MIRFHNASSLTVDVSNVVDCPKLLFSHVTPSQTTPYASIPRSSVIEGRTPTGELVFRVKLKSENKHTLVLSDKLQILDDCYDLPPQGTALVRKVGRDFVGQFSCSPLGDQTVTLGSSSIQSNFVNQGVYTAFFYSSNSLVLYNSPCRYEQDLCFPDYVGVWNVVAKLGNVESTYNFSEVATSTSVERLSNSEAFDWIVHETDYETYSLNGSLDRQRLAILARPGKCVCLRKLVRKARKLGYVI
jgi:hypothetical protein